MTNHLSDTSPCMGVEALSPVEQEREGVILALSSALPWAISLVLHIGLFLVLFFAVATLVRDISARTSGLVVAEKVVINKHPNYLPPPNAETAKENTQTEYPLVGLTGFAMQPGEGEDLYVGLDKNKSASSVRYGPSKSDNRILGINGPGLTDGNGKGGPLAKWAPLQTIGKPDGTIFPLVQGKGNVCYIIDRSGSMLETFDFVKAEMIRSVNTLGPNSCFHAIFFAEGAPIESPPSKLVPATAANKQQLQDFLHDVVPTGLTNPAKAMERAFAVTNDKGEKVQIIYLLTDGEFSSENVAKIRKLNADRKVRINTISFLSDSGRSQLEAISKDSGGKYRFVTRDQVGVEQR